MAKYREPKETMTAVQVLERAISDFCGHPDMKVSLVTRNGGPATHELLPVISKKDQAVAVIKVTYRLR